MLLCRAVLTSGLELPSYRWESEAGRRGSSWSSQAPRTMQPLLQDLASTQDAGQSASAAPPALQQKPDAWAEAPGLRSLGFSRHSSSRREGDSTPKCFSSRASGKVTQGAYTGVEGGGEASQDPQDPVNQIVLCLGWPRARGLKLFPGESDASPPRITP